MISNEIPKLDKKNYREKVADIKCYIKQRVYLKTIRSIHCKKSAASNDTSVMWNSLQNGKFNYGFNSTANASQPLDSDLIKLFR